MTMQKVTIKDEYCELGEHGKVYLVVEDNGDRLFIQLAECDLAIVPQELVTRDMVNFI